MAAAPAVLSGWGSVILEEAAVDDVTVDFAVAAWREDGIWQAVTLPPRSADSLDSLAAALRAQRTARDGADHGAHRARCRTHHCASHRACNRASAFTATMADTASDWPVTRNT